MNFVKAYLLLCTELQLAILLYTALLSAEQFEEVGLHAVIPKTIQYAGRPVPLDCEIPNSENLSTYWSKIPSRKGGTYVSISNGTEHRDDRYTLVENPRRSTTTLQIENLQPADEGLYQCALKYPNGTVRFSYTIELGIRE